jgi:hypothetical protein
MMAKLPWSSTKILNCATVLSGLPPSIARDIGIRRARVKPSQLLKEIEKAKGAREPDATGRGNQRSSNSTSEKTLADYGLSKGQSSRFQKLAASRHCRADDGLSPTTALYKMLKSWVERDGRSPRMV